MKKDYGGAFDIDPETYWSRSDLDELQSAIEDELSKMGYNKLGNNNVVLERMYCDSDNKFELDCRVEDWEDFTVEVKVDLRRAKTLQDLIRVYAPQFVEEIITKQEEVSNAIEEQERGL